MVQYGCLRAARDWAGWHGWPEHRRGAWLYERRSRRLPRHPLGGRTIFQFRLETTNVFNIVNLVNPGTALNAPANFGKIRSARDMRRIQLGARLSF